MRDRFRAEEYGVGIEAGMNATIRLLAGPPPKPPTAFERFGTWLDEWFVAIIAGMVFVFLMIRNWLMDQTYRVRRCPNCGRRGMQRSREVLTEPTRKETGERAVDITCRNCDYHDHQTHVIPVRTKSSSSGGSGFGGGSSSGGGGGGRW